jgi:hypothetical protein
MNIEVDFEKKNFEDFTKPSQSLDKQGLVVLVMNFK